MSKVLFSCVPAYGLANPSLPLVKALVDAGHEVTYLIPDSFRDKVENCGATHVPFAPYLDGPITDPRQVARVARRMFQEMSAETVRLGRSHDAVVGAGMQPELPRLERELDVPVVFDSPVFLQSERVLTHLMTITTGLPTAVRKLAPIKGVRMALSTVATPAIFGTYLPDILQLMMPRSSTLNISPASAYYQPYAEDFDPATCLLAGSSPTINPPDPDFPIERLRDHDGPVIYGTLGTVFNRWTPFFRTLADAFADSDALLVLTTGNKANLDAVGPVADNVILRPFVPQSDVLAHADLCFTHGGFGSATDVVGMGVTPIFTPMGADQFFNAYRVAELGAGHVLPKKEFTVDTVRRAADRALADRPTAGLMRLQESLASAGGPARAVQAIEAVLAGRTPG